MQAGINASGSAIEVGVPTEILQAPFVPLVAGARGYEVSPDGKTIYMIGTKETTAVPITLVTNWTAGVKK